MPRVNAHQLMTSRELSSAERGKNATMGQLFGTQNFEILLLVGPVGHDMTLC